MHGEEAGAGGRVGAGRRIEAAENDEGELCRQVRMRERGWWRWVAAGWRALRRPFQRGSALLTILVDPPRLCEEQSGRLSICTTLENSADTPWRFQQLTLHLVLLLDRQLLTRGRFPHHWVLHPFMVRRNMVPPAIIQDAGSSAPKSVIQCGAARATTAPRDQRLRGGPVWDQHDPL